MVKVRLNGGLGNQLFQYAFAYSLMRRGYDVLLDSSGFGINSLHNGLEIDGYEIDLPIVHRLNLIAKKKQELVFKYQWLENIFTDTVVERSGEYCESLLSPPTQSIVSGYFQTERYFKQHRPELLDHLQLPRYLRLPIEGQINVIKESFGMTSVHIRRGDFLTNPELYGVCDKEYYLRAIALIKQKFPCDKFLFFSDDMRWVKENFNDTAFLFAEDSNSAKQDLYLMSLCSNHILSNSSFSWWGAWLNCNDKKIIVAPSKWYVDGELERSAGDVVPHDWLRI